MRQSRARHKGMLPQRYALGSDHRRWFVCIGIGFLTIYIALIAPAGAAESEAAQDAEPRHAIAMHGEPKHDADFEHFDYVNPDAPKGGTLHLPVIGSFDSLAPFIVRGQAAVGLRGHVFESLLARGYGEPFSMYGLIAESVEMPEDRSSITFHLREDAHFSDGTPVTVEDVIFSLETLRDLGRPNFGYYYSKVSEIERPGPNSVRFVFDGSGDREIPLILSLMPILPKHVYEKRPFDRTTLEKPVGSGPYVVDSVDVGTRVTYRRAPDYWGAELPVNRGQNNAEQVVYEYFRDENAAFEAFKAGLVDLRIEEDPGRWTLGYEFGAARRGEVKKTVIDNALPSGMYAMVFNTRRPVFADPKVREALTLLFDFEWTNKSLYHGLYSRTQSFFDDSELSSHGRPASAGERALLAPFPDAVRPEIMEGGWQAPTSEGSGRNRRNRAQAVELLREAGYGVREGKVVELATGEPLRFEILVARPKNERLALTYTRGLQKAGIEARVRLVDPSQYQQRLDTYDFDMIFYNWDASLSPGNEQQFYWGSASADRPGTRNYMGMRSQAADAMIQAMLEARDREAFVDAVRALDRVLLSGNYVIPLFHRRGDWIAYWDRLSYPDTLSLYGYLPETWWIDETAETASENPK